MFKKFVFFFLFFLASLSAEDHFFSVKGYLGHEELTSIFKEIDALKNTMGGRVVIQLSSSSGEFQAAFNLAQNLFELRRNNQKLIVVYIQGRAVGPAAMLPFLADEIIVTPFVAWGDVPYGSHRDINLDRTRSLIKGLINPNLDTAPALRQLADAMVDPHYQLVYEQGHAAVEKEQTKYFEPLILNLKGMQSLGLVSQVMADDEFLSKFTAQSKAGPSKRGVVSDYVTPIELNNRLEKHIHYSETEENLIGYLHIEPGRPINQSTYLYFKFALEDFREKNVRFVLLHLNTPGGEVLSSLKIVDLLQKMDLNYGIPIVAYIDNWAVSAGAMLAYACRFIAVNPHSLMGAAEPVLIDNSQQMQSAPEKVNSALRAEFANLASFFGRNPLIAEAMVDKEMILVVRNHQIVKLQAEDEIQRGGANPDIVITNRGKLLTLNAKQLIDLSVADLMVPVHISPVDQVKYEKSEKWPATHMPLFNLSVFSKIPHAVIIAYKNWRITFFTILSNPIVMSLLFIGLVIGLYIEINTPGFGFPGSIGLACLALILLSSFSTEAINWIEIIILIGGLILLAIELFIIPGFGVVGILGIILTIIGLFALMLPGVDQLNVFHWDGFQLVGTVFLEKLAYLCGALIFSLIVIIMLARFYSHRFFRFSKLVLHEEQEGFVSGIPRELMPEEGELGETITPLRPSGKALIGEHIYDAIAQTGYLNKSVTIEVVRIEGSRLIVRPVDLKT